MNGILFNPVPSGDKSHDAADVAAEDSDLGRAKSILDIASDQLVVSHADDLKIIFASRFEVMFSSRGGAIEVILQSPRYLNADKQLFSHSITGFLLLVLEAGLTENPFAFDIADKAGWCDRPQDG